jgi:hypothetical protein
MIETESTGNLDEFHRNGEGNIALMCTLCTGTLDEFHRNGEGNIALMCTLCTGTLDEFHRNGEGNKHHCVPGLWMSFIGN